MPLPESIQRWIITRAWRHSFEAKDVTRGLGYANSPPISNLEIREDGEDLIIHADVRGTQRRPYHVELEIYPLDRDIECAAECTCPVATQCKHGAAVLEFLSRSPSRANAASSPAAPTKLSPDIGNWVRLLGLDAEHAQSRAKSRDFLAYCIEPPSEFRHDTTPVIELRKASDGPQVGLRVNSGRARARADSPAAYFQDDDIPLVALYQSLGRDPFDSPPLQGKGWNTLIDGALRMGRLFYGREGGTYVRLEMGPTNKVKPVWRENPDGGVRPALHFDGHSDLTLLPLDPPYYLDPENGRIGRLESKTHASILKRWQSGPTLAAETATKLEEHLAPLTARGLPAPVSRPTETLPAAPPQPHLRVANASLGPRYDRYPTVLGELRFSYHDSPPFDPLAHSQPPECSWLRGGKRCLSTRNLKAERKHEKHLEKTGLNPLHKLFRSQEFAPEQSHHLTFSNPFPSIQSAWMNWIENHADTLRAEGWTIEVDPDTGLVVHDVGEFVPAIEAEPDHGIDWFRFDLKGEVDGKPISLLPFIAEALRHGLPDPDETDLPDSLLFTAEDPDGGFIRFPTDRFLEICHHVAHLFQGNPDAEPRLDRIAAAGLAHSLEMDGSGTVRALAEFGRKLSDIQGLPARKPPATLQADLRPYQLEGYRWLRFLADNGLNGILADDMGLGKTVQTLAFLAAHRPKKAAHKPSLVIAPTSVITNWAAEAARFTPALRTLLLHGPERKQHFGEIPTADLVLTSYPLLARDHETLQEQPWHTIVLDEAQAIKNPRTAAAKHACSLDAAHRFCLSGTPMENHLGEL
jgi:hypothetical protein